MYNRRFQIVGLKRSVSRYFLLCLEYQTLEKMQHVSNRKSKVPRFHLSRVGLTILNNRTKIFCERFGVLTTVTISFAVFSDVWSVINVPVIRENLLPSSSDRDN